MNPDGSSRFNVTAEELRLFPWQNLIANSPRKDCIVYWGIFGKESQALRTAGEELGARVTALLSEIASFQIVSGSAYRPFEPLWSNTDGTSSFHPDALTDEDLWALRQVLDEIHDPEFRARIADVIWVQTKDFPSAKIAVNAYLESFHTLRADPEAGFSPFWRLRRAGMIAAKRGFEPQQASIGKAVDIELLTIAEDPARHHWNYETLVRVLLKFQSLDLHDHAERCSQFAEICFSQGKWEASETYWRALSVWYRESKEDSRSSQALGMIAESLVAQAEEDSNIGRYDRAADRCGRALEAARSARLEKSRLHSIHQRFLDLQRLSLENRKSFDLDLSGEEGLGDRIQRLRHYCAVKVSNLGFSEAVAEFAKVAAPTKARELREMRSDPNSDSILFHIPIRRIDRDGKIVGKSDPDTHPSQPDGESVRSRLTQMAAVAIWPKVVEDQIEPARQTIVFEHPIREQDLAFLVENNPFVPPCREYIFVRGIQAGFFGDWLVAMHLLVPQIEASLRHLLQRRGVVTSTFDTGVQREKNINDLLWLPEVVELLGEDVVFDFRGILIDQFGSNLRNDLAHGLMSEGEFYQPVSVYLWWLVVHLCWHAPTLFAAGEPAFNDDEGI